MVTKRKAGGRTSAEIEYDRGLVAFYEEVKGLLGEALQGIRPVRRGLRVEAQPELSPREGANRAYVEVEWVLGGVSGGSCWSDSGDSHHPTLGDPEPDFEALDLILEHFAPKVTYLEYKRLKGQSEYSSRVSTEMYGNSTTHGTRRLQLRAVYDFLLQRGYLNRSSEV